MTVKLQLSYVTVTASKLLSRSALFAQILISFAALFQKGACGDVNDNR